MRSERHIPRRLLGLLACGILIAASACAPAASPSAPAQALAQRPASAPTPTAPPTPTALAPRSGGAFVILQGGNPPDFDTAAAQNGLIQVAAGPAYSKLVQFDPGAGKEVVPDLAEKWDVSADGTTYTFTIRKGVTWHDGKPLNEADIVYSLNRLLKPPKGTTSSIGAILGPAVERVESNGGQIKLVLKYPFAPTLTILAMDFSPIYSKQLADDGKDMRNVVMGTGPFKFVSYTPSVSVELARNPDYYMKGRPFLDGVSVRIIPDQQTRLSAMRTGRAHMTGRFSGTLSPSEVDALKKDVPNMQMFRSATLRGPWLFWNLRAKPFQDIRVRQAVSLALDRQAALKVVAEGAGKWGSVFPFDTWGLTQDELSKLPGFSEQKEQDIAAAKKLLFGAGYADGFSLSILSRGERLTKNSAVFMASQLGNLGINATVEVQEDAIFWKRGADHQFAAMVFTPGATIPDPIIMTDYFIPGGRLDFSGNEDDSRLVEMWDVQRRSLDVVKRQETLKQVERYILTESYTALPVVWPYSFLAVAPNVHGWVSGPSDYSLNGLRDIWLEN
ncbi:MAG: ABC transporter substrate-binding protein [Dehalococcoidia bacterium]|nr:ABC transporter substrate-binding protein [Dehalococcoidia bacterium]